MVTFSCSIYYFRVSILPKFSALSDLTSSILLNWDFSTSWPIALSYDIEGTVYADYSLLLILANFSSTVNLSHKGWILDGCVLYGFKLRQYDVDCYGEYDD